MSNAVRLVAGKGKAAVRRVLESGSHVIGAAAEADVTIEELTISRRHARLVVGADGSLTLEDLSSSNGTRVDGRRLAAGEVCPVLPGQRLRLGEVGASLEWVSRGDLTAAVAADAAPAGLAEPEAGRQHATLVAADVSRFCVRELPDLMKFARQGADPVTLASRLLAALRRIAPDAAFVLSTDDQGRIADIGQPTSDPERISDGGWTLEFSSEMTDDHATLRQLGGLALDLLGLSHLSSKEAARPAVNTANHVPLPAPETAHPNLAAIYHQARRIAPSDISVLITGETGTGKEVLARFVHTCSDRPDGMLVELNCAALPEDLLEAELFGIESGVATGVTARPGKFELADGGTLMLDEIGDMSLNTQAKILRVLQERQVFRLGARRPRPARVRVLAATNQPVADMVEAGTFRRDLYHRIADWTVRLPRLRERRDDIINLAAHFLRAELARQGQPFGGLSEKAANALRQYAWPGNVRELEREMKRCALFLERGEMLGSEHLQAHIRETVGEGYPGHLPDSDSGDLKSRLQATEARAITQALQAANNDVEAAAADLGVGKSTLYRRIRELGIRSD